MNIARLSGREFNQNIGRAKCASQDGPVIITDPGKSAHVLLGYEQYQKLSGNRRASAEALAMPPGGEDIELGLPERCPLGLRIPDLCY